MTPETLCSGLEHTVLSPIKDTLLQATKDILTTRKHGDLVRWVSEIDSLPVITPSSLMLNNAAVTIGCVDDCDDEVKAELKQGLMALHPWRKGPFNLFGVEIDSEWRSDMKWSRLEEYLGSFQDKTVLDIGCGNGYYLLRMLGSGAKCALGIDPTLLFLAQFTAIKKYLANLNGFILPLKSEELQFTKMEEHHIQFDTVLSMGILYHRRNPVDHLMEAKKCLKPGGELILETLIIDGDEEDELIPEGRYAKMRNVWTIPTIPKLLTQLQTAGFTHNAIVDVSKTTSEEQRRTQWMKFESLGDFLDPNNSRETMEGHPAPRRVVVHCQYI
ncbi:MAG: tRNA 5-methoxyuridine(34)/uridine 5-oxyacetic acid(34) synthase CmoB [Gammaproteobacteria bacterium]|nr:tRNA 5-methoxyuridine(34)/uridine 5-oxyacetic acid(34) synthase CmoB [Gammaproteobacteria bacterium]